MSSGPAIVALVWDVVMSSGLGFDFTARLEGLQLEAVAILVERQSNEGMESCC